MKNKNFEFYTVAELAAVLKVHVNTIYHAVRMGRINALRVSNSKKAPIRILKSEIERMMAYDADKLIDRIVQKRIREKGSLKTPREPTGVGKKEIS